MTILSKGDVIFECQVMSYPIAQITWKRNQRKIHESTSKKFRIINGPNTSYLRITDVNNINYTQWNISCLAENVHGSNEAHVFLNIIPGISNRKLNTTDIFYSYNFKILFLKKKISQNYFQ